MTRLVANMVGYNEENNYLHQVMARIANQVDMICFTDDASTDNTADIAASYGAHVMKMPERTFNVHEGRLRQASWEHLDRCVGKLGNDTNIWVLAIDCDEEFYETQYTVRSLIDQDRYRVLNVAFYHMWNETQYRLDKLWSPHGSTRLFKYYTGGLFKESALACGSEPIYVQHLMRQGKYLTETGLVMKHLSYIKDEDKKAKYDRYTSIDGGKYHLNDHIESIMDSEVTLVDWPL